MHTLHVQGPCYKGMETLHEEEYVLHTGLPCQGLDSSKKNAIIHKAMRYVHIGDQIHHKGVDAILCRLLMHDEIQVCLKASHEEGCGGHYV